MQPIKNASDFIRTLWTNGQKTLAEQQEVSARAIAVTQGVKGYYPFFSCAAEKVLDSYITNDPETQLVKEQAQLLQGYEYPVLIQGPSGTGKELLARALHGSRKGKFVAVNCTGLPDELIESELFGHAKGAFTGAITERVGKFRAAFGGTIFLDEIGDMPQSMQAKLLRVLQEKVVCPIGSDIEEPINCRVVAATNKELSTINFREDVLYRLNTFELKTKGLDQRICDIEDIVDSLGGEGLVTEFMNFAKTKPDDKADDIYKEFFSLSGNVRSLQAQVLRYKILGKIK
jgi:transcriptional regulator with PAS, ATPase and Fis domain